MSKKEDEAAPFMRFAYERGAIASFFLAGERVVNCNEAAAKAFGVKTRAELVGKHPRELSPEFQPDGMSSTEGVSLHVKDAIEKGESVFEWNHKRVDNGEEFPVMVTLQLGKVEGKDVLMVSYQDIKSLVEARKAHKENMHKLADDFENSVKGIVTTVSSSATEMQSNAESMSAIAEETARQSTAVVAATEEAATNVQTVASAAEELNASISEINRQIGDSVNVAASCVKEAESTGEVMQSLDKSVENIGAIVKLIDDIAGQVNLLALNATIEAARAGEAGRGFAVVATEVKNLASQTSNAAQNITKQIGDVQSQTKRAVDAISGITNTIKQVNGISTAIASAVEEQGAATKEIARNVQQASQGTSEVTRNISGVTQAATETGKASSQVLQASGRLLKESETLRSTVEDFIAKIRAG